jgi:hypothetical protein
MLALRISETSVNFDSTHGAVSQVAVTFTLAAVENVVSHNGKLIQDGVTVTCSQPSNPKHSEQ